MNMRAEARLLGATLKAGETTEYALGEDHHAYLAPANGSVEVNGVCIDAHDHAAISHEAMLRVTAIEDAEIVLVDAR